MADKTPDQEPSIEEILASIRQIISDDEDKDIPEEKPVAPAPPAKPAPSGQSAVDDIFENVSFAAAEQKPAPEPVFERTPEPGPEPEDDVLELTDPIVEEAAFAEEEPIEIDLQDQPVVEEAVAPTPSPPPPAPEVTMTPPHKPVGPSADDILTETARNATISSMAKLAGNMPITRHRDYGNITLEDLVREMLHPMLKDWLSDNLPPMVERMVQKELEKLARQAQDV